jgi:hypothetical protein
MTTSNPIRPEVSDNRRHIRNQTDVFLSDIQFNLSDYASLQYLFSSDVLAEAGAVETSGTGALEASIIKKPDPALTGALSPPLPMYISVASQENTRLQFMMLINPANMTHGKTSTVQAAYTRKGFITQMWGPDQDLITSTGKTAAFMVDGAGLTNLSRRRTFAYANFLAFLLAYRNNGYQMLDPTQLSARLTRVINVIHGVEISYDNHIFMGHFNNFTIDEAAERPFLFDYNFEFVCSSLDDTHEEIRGHYIPLDVTSREIEEGRVKILKNVSKKSEVSVPIYTLDNLNQPMENEIEPGTGRVNPGLSFIDPLDSLLPY